jgi:hypothetical protein
MWFLYLVVNIGGLGRKEKRKYEFKCNITSVIFITQLGSEYLNTS